MASLLKFRSCCLALLPAREIGVARLVVNTPQPAAAVIKGFRIVISRRVSVPRSLHVPSPATITPAVPIFSTTTASITTREESTSTTNTDATIRKLQQQKLKGVGRWWIRKYIDLCEFKHKYGHCDVPSKYKYLREWCNKQRVNYGLKKLKKQQIRILNDEGFIWDVDQILFDDCFAELQKFKSEHNHCLVPTRKSNEKLACSQKLRNWVRRMRSQYAKSKSLLDPEKIRMLDDISFVWNADDYFWKARFEELERFVYWHGHCAVPKNYKPNPGLGNWTRMQRFQYENHQRGEPSLLTEERLRMLEKIRFPVGLEDNSSAEKWDIMFQQVKEYKATHGHFWVQATGYRKLARWMRNQRHFYACGKLPNDFMGQLNSIGFDWEPNSSGAWFEMYQNFKKYKEAQAANSFRYPPYRTSLGRWIFNQRQQYRLMLSGDESKLTQDKLDMLNSVGFEFTPSIVKSWEERFEMLKKYEEEHGNCLVPKKNNDLGMWVVSQRTQYRYLQEGKKSTLTQNKIDLLDGVGFTWRIKKNRMENKKERAKK